MRGGEEGGGSHLSCDHCKAQCEACYFFGLRHLSQRSTLIVCPVAFSTHHILLRLMSQTPEHNTYTRCMRRPSPPSTALLAVDCSSSRGGGETLRGEAPSSSHGGPSHLRRFRVDFLKKGLLGCLLLLRCCTTIAVCLCTTVQKQLE